MENNKRKKRTVVLIASAALLILLGTTTYIIVQKARKKKLEGEIDTLLTIARNEGKMTENDYQKYRKLMYMQDFNLPSNYQAAFNKIKPLLQSAGNSIRNGYAVSSQQYFADIRSRMQGEPTTVKNMYNIVEGLLAEAFKLNAPNASIQEKINSSKEKSQSLWQSILYIHPIGAVYNIASGYSKAQWEDARRFFDEQTVALLPENLSFNKKLLSQDFSTLKLFSDAYSALSGGKDYFAVQKTPKG